MIGHHFRGQKVKGQGHQAALLTAAFTHQAAAAVSVGKYSPWVPTATLPSASAAVGSAARGASAPTEGGEGRGHIVAAARLQLVELFKYKVRQNAAAVWRRLSFADLAQHQPSRPKPRPRKSGFGWSRDQDQMSSPTSLSWRLSRSVIGHPGQLSLAIPSCVSAMSSNVS